MSALLSAEIGRKKSEVSWEGNLNTHTASDGCLVLGYRIVIMIMLVDLAHRGVVKNKGLAHSYSNTTDKWLPVVIVTKPGDLHYEIEFNGNRFKRNIITIIIIIIN